LKAKSNEARAEVYRQHEELKERKARQTRKIATMTADVINAKTILFKQGQLVKVPCVICEVGNKEFASLSWRKRC